MKNLHTEPINGRIDTFYMGRDGQGRSAFKQIRTIQGKVVEESEYKLLDSPKDMLARAAVDISSEETWREIIARQAQTWIDAEKVMLC